MQFLNQNLFLRLEVNKNCLNSLNWKTIKLDPETNFLDIFVQT